eukprot:607796-Alexandrium_andersonii.AAC.1
MSASLVGSEMCIRDRFARPGSGGTALHGRSTCRPADANSRTSGDPPRGIAANGARLPAAAPHRPRY